MAEEERDNRFPVNGKADPFVSSMSFAWGATQRDCDCDDCVGVPLPKSFSDAIREHKRRKLEETPVRRTQERALVVREEGVSVWKLTMPLDAEPLVEFGGSHRIVYVQSLPEGSQLKGIGEGIIGSSDEESGRKLVNWKQGQAYLIPSNGGKALGWIHEKDEESNPKGHVVLFTIKMPVGSLNEKHEKAWVQCASKIFQKIIPSKVAGDETEQKSRPLDFEASTGVPLSEEDCRLIEEALKTVRGVKNGS